MSILERGTIFLKCIFQCGNIPPLPDFNKQSRGLLRAGYDFHLLVITVSSPPFNAAVFLLDFSFEVDVFIRKQILQDAAVCRFSPPKAFFPNICLLKPFETE